MFAVCRRSVIFPLTPIKVTQFLWFKQLTLNTVWGRIQNSLAHFGSVLMFSCGFLNGSSCDHRYVNHRLTEACVCVFRPKAVSCWSLPGWGLVTTRSEHISWCVILFFSRVRFWLIFFFFSFFSPFFFYSCSLKSDAHLAALTWRNVELRHVAS